MLAEQFSKETVDDSGSGRWNVTMKSVLVYWFSPSLLTSGTVMSTVGVTMVEYLTSVGPVEASIWIAVSPCCSSSCEVSVRVSV